MKVGTMSLRLAAIAFIVIAVGSVATFGIPRETSQSNLAERLWEQSNTAKGGREALYGVRNLVVSAWGDYLSGVN